MFKDVAAANPDIKLFGPDGVAESAFSEKLGSKVEKNAYITNPTLDPKEYPPVGAGLLQGVQVEVRQGSGAVRDLRLRGHGRRARGDQAAGDKGNDRQAVVDEFFKTKGRESVLGTYDIDENGDTTLSDYGGNRIEGGKLVFDKVIKAQTGN